MCLKLLIKNSSYILNNDKSSLFFKSFFPVVSVIYNDIEVNSPIN